MLQIMGRSAASDFQTYHRVLNRAVWSPLTASQLLLRLLIAVFIPRGVVVVGLDDTIERRAVYLSYAANCDGPLPSGLRVVNQPAMRSSLAVSGPRAARVASSRTHLPPIISRPSGSAPAYSCWGCGHGGTRNIKTSRSVHTRLVNPAAIAGVPGRHCVAVPVPFVGTGCGKGWRTLACGRQKL